MLQKEGYISEILTFYNLENSINCVYCQLGSLCDWKLKDIFLLPIYEIVPNKLCSQGKYSAYVKVALSFPINTFPKINILRN